MFAFLDCWDHSIYLALFLSILAISITYGLIERSFRAIRSAFWDYTSVILSDYFARQQLSIKTRILATIWLLVNTLLLSIYSGEMYDIIISGQKVDKIEGKHDLLVKENWKNSNIIMFDMSSINYIVAETVKNDPVGIQLKERIVYYDPVELYFDDTLLKVLIEEVIDGNKVMTANKLVLYYFIRRAQNIWPQNFDNYIEGYDYYISKPENSSGFYFLLYMPDMLEQDALQDLNLMYEFSFQMIKFLKFHSDQDHSLTGKWYL